MAMSKAVIKTLKILELISKNPEGITLSEIYRELDMPKATVYDILQALYQEDAVYYKNEHSKTYVIGSKLYVIGQSYSKNSNFINYARPMLTEFANKYGVTTFGCKRLSTKVTYVFKYESYRNRLSTLDVNVQPHLSETLVGVAFLAFLPRYKSEELLERILLKEFNGVRDSKYDLLVERVSKYRDLGYVFDNGENEKYICEIVVPVYNFENKMTGAIYATGLKLEDERIISEFIKEFRDIAEAISFKQGYKR